MPVARALHDRVAIAKLSKSLFCRIFCDEPVSNSSENALGRLRWRDITRPGASRRSRPASSPCSICPIRHSSRAGEGITNAAVPGPLIDAMRGRHGAVRDGRGDVRIRQVPRREGRVQYDRAGDPGNPLRPPHGIARSVSTVASHPGKTLYDCVYRITAPDKTGKSP